MKGAILLFVLSCTLHIGVTIGNRIASYRVPDSNVILRLNNLGDKLQYTIEQSGQILQSTSFHYGYAHNATVKSIENGFAVYGPYGPDVEFRLNDKNPNFTLFHIFMNLTQGQQTKHCMDLNTNSVSWYGGPEQRYQYWPIEKLTFSDYSYVTKETDNCGITERYWLNSKGVFIYVDEGVPLFIDQNTFDNSLCLIAKQQLPYSVYTKNFTMNYFVGVERNARYAHIEAVNRFLKKPVGHPDERMVRHPIWSTWARYKVDINESTVLKFADEILANRFNNSQFEIDDDWEVCYGALTVRQSKFPNMKNLTTALKAKGFHVTLWIHPFINKGCEPWYTEAKNKDYLVKSHRNSSTDTQWWNSKWGESAYVDFTNPEAAKWFSDRLETLEIEAGIDSFKFDAGETSWSPPDPILHGPENKHPNLITSEYVRTVAKFGSLVEVRSGQNTQDLPIFLRMLDKDSEWYWNNGLPTLVTTLLQLNMVGYPFVLPDMIGGNGYNNHPPNAEMFLRWLQANVFMPSLQFSYVPWDYDNTTISLSRRFTDLHANFTDLIMHRFKLAVEKGDPVNPPLWWVDPNDRVAQQINDQFLLGEDVIAAPVLREKQVTRDVYLPKGSWRDGNTNVVYNGPRWIMDYPAPLSVLPYFIRQGPKAN